MDNPLDKPRRPENFVQDIEDLARDLAYGAKIGLWNTSFTIDYFDRRHVFGWAHPNKESPDLKTLFYEKWAVPRNAPDYDSLRAYGFMELSLITRQKFDVVETSKMYSLTRQAFDLLQKPAQAPSIFISYRHADSSALALLIEARLILAGADSSRIFIDKTIPGGDSLDDHIYKRASACDVFICLIGSDTTFSAGTGVLAELEIVRARNPKPRIIWVCHNGVADVATYVPADLRNLLGRVVPRESAIEYELTISYILNALDYKPYWPSPTSPFSGLGTN